MDQNQLFERLRIITLGAVVELPAVFKHVKQYLGALDWFGSANSSLGVTHERVPGTGASLSIPPIAVTKPAPMSAVKAKDAVRKPPKKVAKLPSVAPKMPSPTPKVASSALEATPKVATPLPRRRSRR